jgi:plasmid stabilization system protein ParE
MEIRYLPSSRNDLVWWRKYYRENFPQGKSSAFHHMRTTETLLKQNPRLGTQIENRDLRRLIIPNTPFMIVYRIRPDTLEILRIWDMRQKPVYGFQEG